MALKIRLFAFGKKMYKKLRLIPSDELFFRPINMVAWHLKNEYSLTRYPF